MIVFREYRDADLKEVKDILIQEKIQCLNIEGIIYVVLDSKKLIGLGQAQLENGKYFLKYLIIDKEERNNGFGDCLLRAILFKLGNNNIEKLYFKGYNKYLLKKGFKKNIVDILFIDINEFFDGSCNCTGESHGL